MTLTPEQLRSVRQGEPVMVSDPEIGPDCVLLRADVYARVKNLLYDDSEFDPRVVLPSINEVMKDDDALDPWLESYQN
jgi:hypothetical protein